MFMKNIISLFYKFLTFNLYYHIASICFLYSFRDFDIIITSDFISNVTFYHLSYYIGDSIYDYLRGQIAGVNVSSDEEITIRGYNSINGDMTPLFILNETTVSKEIFGNIRPLDIKSVTVLKGPETTRYGVRGANGVIIVTTK